jgi:uncharacterized protein
VLTQRIREREFALSGSDQNPELTRKSLLRALGRTLLGAPGPMEAFKQRGVDFVVARTLPDLVRGMNALTDEPLVELAALEREIVARDRQVANPFGKDLQLAAKRGATVGAG